VGNTYPNAVQVPQGGGGDLNTSLPPRVVWHITWDKLNADGSQPQFSAVAGYLQRQGYCPHLMWNPFTGYIEQYYPADQSARALAAWNQDGQVCIQIETFFTPGCVVDGVKYDSVSDTPCVGMEELLNWLDSFGIPRVWPFGSPQWQGNSRNPDVWNANAGHYGHCNVPDNDHTDPGPMPDITTIGVTDNMTISDAQMFELKTWVQGCANTNGDRVINDNRAQINAAKQEILVAIKAVSTVNGSGASLDLAAIAKAVADEEAKRLAN